MKKLLFLLVVICLSNTVIYAQQGVAINTTASKADASAILDVSSSNKGLLIPRMSSAARKAIVNPAAGLMVYDSTERTLYMNDGFHWLGFSALTDYQRPADNLMYGPVIADTTLAGYSVSVWDQFAAIGAPYVKTATGYTGAVYIYKNVGGEWQYFTTLLPTGNSVGSQFGTSVSLKGNYLIVGAPYHLDAALAQKGAAYTYNFNGTSWENMQTMFGANNGTQYGQVVAISQFGTTAAVSEPGSPFFGNQTVGVVDVYERSGVTFSLEQIVYDPALVEFEHFGEAMAISPAGSTLLIGAPAKKVNGHNANGYIGLYKRNASTWTETFTFAPPSEDNLNIGLHVDLNDNYAVFSVGKYNRVYYENMNWMGSGEPPVYSERINSICIDPTSNYAYIFSGNSIYSLLNNSTGKLKTIAVDNNYINGPQLLSAFGKTFVAGVPTGADNEKPFRGAFYFGKTSIQ